MRMPLGTGIQSNQSGETPMKQVKKLSNPTIVLLACLSLLAASSFFAEVGAVEEVITPLEYVSVLGKGMDVDWAKTKDGMKYYDAMAVQDFRKRGLRHARIRVSQGISTSLLQHLDRVIGDCLQYGLIPIVAYQADSFKKNPTPSQLSKVVAWWTTIAERYQSYSPLLSFDLLIEATDAVNKKPGVLNQLYEKAVAAIRKTNPERIIFISPRLRSDPDYLDELTIPTQSNGFLMAEWHFYASGPSKTSPAKLWTTGTPAERKLVTDKIDAAKAWEAKTGVRTWVGAWMPGNYNDGNDYTIAEQKVFARFVSCELDQAQVPFAVNSDTKFYSRETGTWIKKMAPVLSTILHPSGCGN
jgi:hypothetical protein